MRLPSARAVFALQAGDDAGGGRRADAEGKADRDHLIARREIGGRAQRRRHEIVGHRLRLAARRDRAPAAVPITIGLGFHAVEEVDA